MNIINYISNIKIKLNDYNHEIPFNFIYYIKDILNIVEYGLENHSYQFFKYEDYYIDTKHLYFKYLYNKNNIIIINNIYLFYLKNKYIIIFNKSNYMILYFNIKSTNLTYLANSIYKYKFILNKKILIFKSIKSIKEIYYCYKFIKYDYINQCKEIKSFNIRKLYYKKYISYGQQIGTTTAIIKNISFDFRNNKIYYKLNGVNKYINDYILHIINYKLIFI